MKITAKSDYKQELLELSLSDKLHDSISDSYVFRSETSLDSLIFEDTDFEALYKFAQNHSDRSLMMQLTAAREFKKNPSESTMKDLKSFSSMLVDYIMFQSKEGWLIKQDKGTLLPYLITGVLYKPADDNGTPAEVDIKCAYNSSTAFERSSNFAYFYSADVKGKTIPEILASKNIYVVTDEYIDDYKRMISTLKVVRCAAHEQFIANGLGIDEQGWRANFELRNCKCVIDEDIVKRTYTSEFDAYSIKRQVPIHPFVYVYSLQHYCNLFVHVDSLTPYVYDDSLREKLILPDIHKDLLDILVNDADVLRGDIIDGKSGGTTILCSGSPGLGKTLTAECYSEMMHRPLYRISSGQLGTSANDVEKYLKDTLTRAERWHAIMLIDEADTYIKQRGDSIQQNAIVAAFLRTLEYFDGVLFLTTNRQDVVDEAIISRCIATIQYEYPSEENRRAIWTVLSAELGFTLPSVVIEKLLKMFPEVSGRDIKELIKLTGRYIQAKELKSTSEYIDAFITCSQFRSVKCVIPK